MSSNKKFYFVDAEQTPTLIKKLFAIDSNRNPRKVTALYAIDENKIPHLVYKGSVLLTNVLSSTISEGSQFDTAGHSVDKAIYSTKIVADHYYLLRGTSRRYRPPTGITHTSQLRVTAPGINTTFATNKVDQYWGYEDITDETRWEKILVKPNAAGTLTVYFQCTGRCAAVGDMVSSTVWCSTIIDVTEAVDDLGTTDANAIWTALGGTNFYGTKEFEF